MKMNQDNAIEWFLQIIEFFSIILLKRVAPHVLNKRPSGLDVLR